MKVRMKQKITGTRAGKEWPNIGDTIDVPDSEAADLIRIDAAEPVGREAAVVQPAATETATAPRPRGRPRKTNPED